MLAAGAAVDAESARIRMLLAESELRLGRLDDAAASFARAVELEPLNFDAWIERARTLGRLGRFAESAAVLGDALAAAQDFPADRRAALVATLERYRGEMLAASGDAAGAGPAPDR